MSGGSGLAGSMHPDDYPPAIRPRRQPPEPVDLPPQNYGTGGVGEGEKERRSTPAARFCPLSHPRSDHGWDPGSRGPPCRSSNPGLHLPLVMADKGTTIAPPCDPFRGAPGSRAWRGSFLNAVGSLQPHEGPQPHRISRYYLTQRERRTRTQTP